MLAKETTFWETIFPAVKTRSFADWLQGELKARDWSQADLARKAGVSRPTITNLVNGARQPGLEAAIGIAKALGYTTDFVMDRARGEPLDAIGQDAAIDAMLASMLQEFGYTPDEIARTQEFLRFIVYQRSQSK